MSRPFCATIRASRLHRSIVLGTGVVLGGWSSFLIAQLPLPAGWCAAVLAAWLTLTGVELGLLACAYRGVRVYRIESDGAVTLNAPGEAGKPARMLPGSVVLPGGAWLRIGTLRGASWGEFVCACGQDAEEWRRLRVICRHLGAC